MELKESDIYELVLALRNEIILDGIESLSNKRGSRLDLIMIILDGIESYESELGLTESEIR